MKGDTEAVFFPHGALTAWGLPGIEHNATDADFGNALQSTYAVYDN